MSNATGTRTVIYGRRATGWHQEQELSGAIESISANGGALALEHGFGAVELYRLAGRGWIPAGQVIGDGPTGFGAPAMLTGSGRTLLVGDAGAGGAPGVLYVYHQFAGGWAQTAALHDPGGQAAQDGFGATSAISADGTTILASDQSGHHLYPFTYSGGHWMTAPTVSYGPLVGFVALNRTGTRAVVSDYSTRGGTAASVYERDGAKWREIERLRGSGPGVNPGYQEGITVTVDGTGTTVALGASTIVPLSSAADRNFVDVFAAP